MKFLKLIVTHESYDSVLVGMVNQKDRL